MEEHYIQYRYHRGGYLYFSCMDCERVHIVCPKCETYYVDVPGNRTARHHGGTGGYEETAVDPRWHKHVEEIEHRAPYVEDFARLQPFAKYMEDKSNDSTSDAPDE